MWLCSTWKGKLNCMLDNDPLFKASCTFNGMVLLDGLEKWTLFAMISEMDMNVNPDYRWRSKTLIHVDIPTVTDYCRVPVKKIILPCLSLLDAHLQLYLTSKKMVDQSLWETPSARCTSPFWWCDPQLWPRWTSSSWTTWTVAMSTWRPACALAVRNRLCLLHVLQRRERIWVESKNVPNFSAISCFVQSLKKSQRRFPVKDFSGRPLLDFTLVGFTSFLFGQFLLVLCVLLKISSKQLFFCCSVHETLAPDSWVLLGVGKLDFCNLPRFPSNWTSYQVP